MPKPMIDSGSYFSKSSEMTFLDTAITATNKTTLTCIILSLRNLALSEENNICSRIFSFNKEKFYPHLTIEHSMTSIMARAQVLSSQSLAILEVNLTFFEPKFINTFNEIFGGYTVFNSQRN